MFFFFFLPFLLLSNTAEANNPVNIKLGAVKVADRTDRDVIKLPTCDKINNIPVNSIQLQVKISLSKLIV